MATYTSCMAVLQLEVRAQTAQLSRQLMLFSTLRLLLLQARMAHGPYNQCQMLLIDGGNRRLLRMATYLSMVAVRLPLVPLLNNV